MTDRRFPLFLDMTGRQVAVIGGGAVALRRVRTLLEFGAAITVTAPQICNGLRSLEPGIRIQQRPYCDSDIAGAFMVLAATDDETLNHRITLAAKQAGAWANNASCRTDNDFFFPAAALTDTLSVGICGTGEDHSAVAAAAAQIRRTLSEGETT